MCKQANLQEAGKYNVSEHVTAGWALTTWPMQRASLQSEYYHHTVLPAISSFGPTQGGLAGQDLVITGTGFSTNSKNISVSVDGVNCAVQSSTLTSINCRLASKQPTDSAALPSSAGTPVENYIAGVGLKYWRYSTKNLAQNDLNGFKAAVQSKSGNLSLL